MPKAEGHRDRGRNQQYRQEWEAESWAAGWLQKSQAPYNERKAFCKWCKKELRPKKCNLILHRDSSSHSTYCRSMNKQQPSISGFATVDTKSIQAELNVVALIARSNVSFNFLNSLISTRHGIANDSTAVNKMTCNRTKGMYLLTRCLFPYSHECLVKGLKDCGVFSICCDRATDITMKFLCINVRFTPESTTPCTRFYLLLELEEGCASGVFGAISSSLKEDGLDWCLVCGYASDGENLMQGTSNSVLTRFQEAAPGLFVLKCYCHSFNLVAEHANKVLSNHVQDIYNYFKMSPNRHKSLA